MSPILAYFQLPEILPMTTRAKLMHYSVICSLRRSLTQILNEIFSAFCSYALKAITKQRKKFPDKLTRGRQKIYRPPCFGSKSSWSKFRTKIIWSSQLDQNPRRKKWINTTWSKFRVQNTTSTLLDPNPE